jgi:hypothetical protein
VVLSPHQLVLLDVKETAVSFVAWLVPNLKTVLSNKKKQTLMPMPMTKKKKTDRIPCSKKVILMSHLWKWC